MIKKNHNQNSIQLIQKVLVFIDTVFINVASSDSKDSNKILTEGMINIRDALFSEVVRESQIESINEHLKSEQLKKSQPGIVDSKDLTVEKSAEDQSQ
jgi:hypothetical protein